MDFNYVINILKKYISDEKVQHSVRVAESAKKLAIHYDVNKNDLYNAGLLHDIAKELTPEKCVDLKIDCQKYNSCWDMYPSVWHAFVASEVVVYEFGQDCNELSDIMSLHTTGNESMSNESKILFIADFIEPKRKYPEREMIEEFSFQSLEKAVANITYLSIKKLINRKVAIHPYTFNCWNCYYRYI